MKHRPALLSFHGWRLELLRLRSWIGGWQRCQCHLQTPERAELVVAEMEKGLQCTALRHETSRLGLWWILEDSWWTASSSSFGPLSDPRQGMKQRIKEGRSEKGWPHPTNLTGGPRASHPRDRLRHYTYALKTHSFLFNQACSKGGAVLFI